MWRWALQSAEMSPEDSTWEEPIRVRLKVFLAYAWGVGKSSRMFDEGRRCRERG
jgi:K+-sensing histidine kinase KdpD